jgi:hypothetical protein
MLDLIWGGGFSVVEGLEDRNSCSGGMMELYLGRNFWVDGYDFGQDICWNLIVCVIALH